MKIRIAAAIVLTLAGSLPAQSQAASWDPVRGLSPGAQVRATTTSGETIRGDVVSTSADGINIRSAQGEVAVEKSKVRRVQVRDGSRRLRNALIGLGIGVALGVVVDQTLGVRLRNEGAGNRAAMYAIPIGLAGALGAAFPGYRTVYPGK